MGQSRQFSLLIKIAGGPQYLSTETELCGPTKRVLTPQVPSSSFVTLHYKTVGFLRPQELVTSPGDLHTWNIYCCVYVPVDFD